MTFQELQCFYTAASCLSFSKTAEILYTTQPTVTKNISKLEEELGFRLFERLPRRIELTREGESFRKMTEREFYTLDQSLDKARILSQSHIMMETALIATTEADSIPSGLVELIYSLQRINGQEYCFSVNTFDSIREKLENRQFDMLISTDRALKDRRGMSYVPLRPFRMNAIMRRDHPLARKDRIATDDLHDQCVLFCYPGAKEAKPPVEREIIARFGNPKNLRVLHTREDVVLNALLGIGIGLAGDIVSTEQYPELVSIPYQELPGAVQYIMWPTDTQNKAVLNLIPKLNELYGPTVEI